jgi:hypothetical protein
MITKILLILLVLFLIVVAVDFISFLLWKLTRDNKPSLEDKQVSGPFGSEQSAAQLKELLDYTA